MRAITTKIPKKTLINHCFPSLSLSSHNLATSAESQKLDRIANELLALNPVELHDYTILLPMKLGLKNSALSALSSAVGPSGSGQPAAQEEPKEKTMFDVKLEKFDAGAKIKIIKEVRGFTELGLKEAKDLVEKTPGFLKKGVTKEEGDAIVEKLKALGATVVLE